MPCVVFLPRRSEKPLPSSEYSSISGDTAATSSERVKPTLFGLILIPGPWRQYLVTPKFPIDWFERFVATYRFSKSERGERWVCDTKFELFQGTTWPSVSIRVFYRFNSSGQER